LRAGCIPALRADEVMTADRNFCSFTRLGPGRRAGAALVRRERSRTGSMAAGLAAT
jgi:hypothetical protein